MSRSILILLFLLASTVCRAPAAGADQPLNIDQLLVDSGRWQVVSGLDYFRSGRAAGGLERSGQLSAGLRYGLAGNLEFNARLHGGELTQRLPGTRQHIDFGGLGVGANWLLKAESASPAWLLEGSLDLVSRQGGKALMLPRARLSLTTYQSFDPLVLSLSGGIAWSRPFHSAGRDVQPGYRWQVAPQVNFAVNHRVTLTGGMALTYREADRFDGRSIGLPQELLRLRLGLGLRLRPRSTLFLTGDFAAGEGGSGLSLQWFATL